MLWKVVKLPVYFKIKNIYYMILVSYVFFNKSYQVINLSDWSVTVEEKKCRLCCLWSLEVTLPLHKSSFARFLWDLTDSLANCQWMLQWQAPSWDILSTAESCSYSIHVGYRPTGSGADMKIDVNFRHFKIGWTLQVQLLQWSDVVRNSGDAKDRVERVQDAVQPASSCIILIICKIWI